MKYAVMRITLLLPFVTGVVNATHYQLLSHNWRLMRLEKFEHKVNNYMKTTLQERISFLQKLTGRFVNLVSLKSAGETKEDYISSTLPALVLTRRLVEDWTSLAVMLQGNHGLSRLGLGKTRWPTPQDLDSAALTVLRAQWTYDLDIGSIATGVVTGNHVLFNVTAADCFHIARVCWNFYYIKEALEWLDLAFRKTNQGDNSISAFSMMQYYPVLKCFSEDSSGARLSLMEMLGQNNRQKIWYNDKLLPAYMDMTEHDCNELFNQVEHRKSEAWYEGIPKDYLEKHRRLCSGEEKLLNNLRCRYMHYQQPHLRFQPFKMEELQQDPPVLRFYDVISDVEAEILKQSALNSMESAGTVTDEGGYQYNRYRTSQVSWLIPGLLRVSDRLTQRLADVTQLNVRTAEPNQVSRYSISGEYLQHIDYLINHGMSFSDDRIATLMIYLNDVKEGGNTIFLDWNTTVKPVKNSAVLWFNYRPNGEVDESSLHSGCPVLQGTKWVLNKWFHNAGQEFKKPCGLYPNDSFVSYYIE